ncbi:unnamed protein product [Cyprideis torosa]|uniref:Uncharacterized protein n=1 Tax=Cyprideis torosa TaxID=163714 RepID=A0A7R8WAY8_9CRUS|nr:unnamed protein product [Cyprideis torosa]CAG0891629.1 unnamed protein product [Cyprideis torosa]
MEFEFERAEIYDNEIDDHLDLISGSPQSLKAESRFGEEGNLTHRVVACGRGKASKPLACQRQNSDHYFCSSVACRPKTPGSARVNNNALEVVSSMSKLEDLNTANRLHDLLY